MALRVSDGSIVGFYVLIVVVHDTPKMHLACVTPCGGQGSYFALGYRVRLFGAVPTAAFSFVRLPWTSSSKVPDMRESKGTVDIERCTSLQPYRRTHVAPRDVLLIRSCSIEITVRHCNLP